VIKKPICFSYREYVELREAYKQLLEDNQQLMADNRRLREKLTNMEIRCRIAEKDGVKHHDCNVRQ
jgi:regulator of replication initiation timing